MAKPKGQEGWDAAIALLVQQIAKTTVADELGIGRKTLYTWMADERFQTQLKAAQKAYDQKRGKQIVKRITMPGDSEAELPDNAQDIGKAMRRIARGT